MDERLKKYAEDLKSLRPLDDDFMRELFRNNIPLAELVLRIILNKPDLTLTALTTQYDMKRLLGARSICLDALCTDAQNRKYDIEIQRANSGARPRRARYHSSAMDIEFLEQNHSFDELPVTYTIFITENDVFNQNQPVYQIARMNLTTGQPFEDDAYIIYVNGAYVGDSDLGRLMHDFRCVNADDMYYPLLAESTRYFKETPKGASYMCKIIEDRMNEMLLEVAMNGLALRTISREDIARMTGLSLDEIDRLATQMQNAAKNE